MKRKILTIVLTFALAFSMTACGGSKKADKKENPKKQETQVEKKEQEVVEEDVKTEELNEYGVTDEEMQLLLDRFQGKIKENKDVCKKFDYLYDSDMGVTATYQAAVDLYTGTDGSLDEFTEFFLEGQEDNPDMWVLFYKSVKELNEEDGVSEEKCLQFLRTTLDDWDTFRDTELKPVYDEAVSTTCGKK